MDVLGNGKIQNSFRKLRYNSSMDERRGQGGKHGGVVTKDEGYEGIYHQTFTHHWEACRERIRGYEPGSERCADDVLTVTAQLEQMVALLQLELSAGNNNAETRILDTILSDSDNILAQVVGWSKCLAPGHVAPVLTLSLSLCEVLVSCRQAGQSVLSHSRIVTPLLSLLDTVHSLNGAQPASPGLQTALLGLVHSLCVLLTESPSLLSLFTSDPGSSVAPRFLLFSLLTPFLHKSSPEGQLARDSLLLCISLSAQHDIVQTYIAEHSNFTTILATGLSGLYSSLPRTLDADNPCWHRLDPETDTQDIPGLGDLVTSLELCSAVLQVASAKISSQLLELIHQGFLVPVLGPALATQDTDPEQVVAATVYTDLFIRVITAPALLATLVRFLMTASVDNKLISEVLVQRISCNGKVCVVTMQLFETLLSLNIEDVMLGLVFRHLVNCNFLLPSFRSKLNYVDPHGRAAYKFLSLVPVSCDPPATPITPRRTPFFQTSSGPNSLANSSHVQSQSYAVYLSDAQNVIRQTHQECSQWTNIYDGISGPSANQNNSLSLVRKSPSNQMKITPKISVELGQDPLEDAADCGGSGPGSLGADTSGYLSGGWDLETDLSPDTVMAVSSLSQEEEEEFWSAVGYDTKSEARHKLSSVLARLQHEDRLSMSSYGSEDVVSPRFVTSEVRQESLDNSPPTLGPFLTAIMNRVCNFPDNGLGINLRLTALVSKLATFPQPLLKAVLLHPDVVVQPACSTLFHAICTARQRIDSVMPGLLGADEAVRSARDDLQNRVGRSKRSASSASIISLPASLDAGLRRGSSILKMFSSKRNVVTGVPETSVPTALPPVPAHTRKMAMAAVLLEEWLQELAALAQEHSVLLQQEKILGNEERILDNELVTEST